MNGKLKTLKVLLSSTSSALEFTQAHWMRFDLKMDRAAMTFAVRLNVKLSSPSTTDWWILTQYPVAMKVWLQCIHHLVHSNPGSCGLRKVWLFSHSNSALVVIMNSNPALRDEPLEKWFWKESMQGKIDLENKNTSVHGVKARKNIPIDFKRNSANKME